MNRQLLTAFGLTLLLAISADAQETGTQTFTVNVPESITIVAPPDSQTLDHDETNDDQVFGAQLWSVGGNTLNGVTVTFQTDQPFTNTTDASFERDARLTAEVDQANTDGPASWTNGPVTDVTDFASNDGEASVQITSDGVGVAPVNLTVEFVTGTFGTFAAGAYETTVTGTVTANP